jgi:hypothetical protein
MKIITTLFVAILISAVLVILPWVAMFAGSFSSKPDDWAAFGDYFGGTLSPLIAAFGLVALLHTIKQQGIEIKLIREQNMKDDIWRVIEKVETDFDYVLTRYPIKVNTSEHTREYSGLDIAFNPTAGIEYKRVMVNEEELLNYVKEKGAVPTDDPKLLAYEIFALAGGHLNQLRIYVEKYSEIAGHNVMTKYFHRKYKVPYDRFFERGHVKELWNVEEQL